MSGPIVRSGPSPEFSKNWDSVFGKNKKTSAKAATKAKPPSAKAATKAKPPLAKAAKKRAAAKSKKKK